MKKVSVRTWLIVAAVVAAAVIIYSIVTRDPAPTELTFSEFESSIAEGRIAEATIFDRSHQVRGTFFENDEEFSLSLIHI